MNKMILASLCILVVLTTFTFQAEARARYSSIRVGGYNSHGKASHYIGGYVRSTHTIKYYLKHY